MTIKPFIPICLMGVLLATGCAAFSDEAREAEIKELGAKVHSLKTTLSETNARVDDLDNRFRLLHEKVQSGAAAPVFSTASAASEQSAPPVPEGLKVVNLQEEAQKSASAAKPVKTEKQEKPEAMYDRAQDLFIAGRYNDAREAFLNFAARYAAHSLADNALYWAGESYYSEKEFDKALELFLEAVDKYPGGNKAPDSLLKAAYSYTELNKEDKAREIFERLIKRYPDSQAAGMAKRTLQKPSAAKKGKG
ncbi:MAG: tol-pal system protein YbgF [Deltaproteobacteria bacterium]|nr:tol-pal system protein YbgF [Deltaproteobacteria bacterium]